MLYGDGVRFKFVEDNDRDYLVNLRNNSMRVKNWFFSPDPFCLWRHDIFMEDVKKKNDKFFIIEIPNGDSWLRIGTVCIYNINFLHRNCEFGRIVIDQGYLHTGPAKNVLSLVYKYCFNDLGMNKIYCEVLKDNTDAVKFYERMGCKIDGVKRQHIFKDGRFSDVLILAILKEEYDASDFK